MISQPYKVADKHDYVLFIWMMKLKRRGHRRISMIDTYDDMILLAQRI